MNTLTTKFQPSFPNPDVWTDELMAKRQAEFIAFTKTPEGMAEEKAFDKVFSKCELLREESQVAGS